MTVPEPRMVVRTACTRDCPDACQLLATVEGGEVVALRGDPSHPITRGFLCHRTYKFLEERQRSPERLVSPLVRRGEELVPTTWNEALDLVASELRKAVDQYGAESIFHYQSGGSLGLLKLLSRRFFAQLGPITEKRGDICSGAGDAAQLSDMGHEDAHDLDDLDDARLVLLFGKNVAETGVHLSPKLKALRGRGVPVIQIDPAYNGKTQSLCDRHVQVRPGGDGYLALGMARTIFDEGLVAVGASDWCDGFEAFGSLARRHSVEEWAAFADVPADVVREIARAYATKTPATLFVGWGLGRRGNGSATVRLLDALAAITGNLGVAGGGVSFYFQRRSGFDIAALVGPRREGARTLLEPLLGEELLRADPKIRVCVVDCGNPVTQLPDSRAVARGLASVDFLVVLDSFLTDTAELANVVLPTATMLEQHDLVAAYGHPYVQLAQPVVSPPPGCRTDLEIWQALADRLGFGDAMRGSAEAWIDRLLAPMADAGVTRAALSRRGQRKPEAPRILFAGRRFPTGTGRFQLVTDFPEPEPAPDATYPLSLLSTSTYRYQSSQIPVAAQTAGPGEVIVHPSASPVDDGEVGRLSSPLGSVLVRVRHDARQRRDVVIYPKGRWAKYGGPNVLVAAKTTDAGEGAAYYDQRVRLDPVR